MDGGFSQPRNGRNNDQAHPPIHPVTYVARNALNADQHRVYEFVTRRFLACCSKSAKGEQTTIELEYGEETFYTNGLNVIERNYLEVYPYQRWESSQELPTFTLHETFEPAKAMIVDGETCAPGYLTEPDLISLMDANGIGTDATMAEHIAKVKERQYVRVQARGSGSGRSSDSLQMFIPTTLGVALIEGYDSIGLDTSLGKPFLRKEMEMKMTDICAGRKSRNDFVHETLDQYREAFAKTQQQVEVLKAVGHSSMIRTMTQSNRDTGLPEVCLSGSTSRTRDNLLIHNVALPGCFRRSPNGASASIRTVKPSDFEPCLKIRKSETEYAKDHKPFVSPTFPVARIPGDHYALTFPV